MQLVLRLDETTLSAHFLRAGYSQRTYRPVSFRLDSDGTGVAVTLPGPYWLAQMLTIVGPVEAFRIGAALAVRIATSGETPQTVSAEPLRASLRQRLAALPPSEGAGDAYRDLRLAATTDSPTFAAYLVEVLRAFVRDLPPYQEPRPLTPRQPGKSALERKRAERERRRTDLTASAEWALNELMRRGSLTSGSRCAGQELHRQAAEVLAEACDAYTFTVIAPDPEDDPDLAYASRTERVAVWQEVRTDPINWSTPPPLRPREVSRQVLYRVASQHPSLRVTRPHGSVSVFCSGVADGYAHAEKESAA